MSSWVYGKHPVLHAIKAGRRKANSLYLLKNEGKIGEITDLCRTKGIPVQQSDPAFFKKILGSEGHHQGLLLEVGDYPYVQINELFDGETVLVLDRIQDPQNLGALCRTAYLFGVTGVLLSEKEAVGVTPSVCRAAAGAVEYLKISRQSSLPKVVEQLKEAGFWIYGADMAGEKSLYDERFPQKTAFVIGAEGRGVGQLLGKRCDILLSIPMYDLKFGSFNASVAGAIFLSERARQKMCQHDRFC